MPPTEEEAAAIAETASRTSKALAKNPTSEETPQKKKRRCNWNPSIWFEIETVVKVIACIGFGLDLICMAYWMWICAMTNDGALVAESENFIQVKMVILHGFLLITELCLFFAVTIKSHILCYIWIFFRIIWFYFAFIIWMIGLNVQQMNVNKEWDYKKQEGLEVFGTLGILEKFVNLFYIMWCINFIAYIVLVFFYTWATVIVAVYACNLLDDFRRFARHVQSMNAHSVSAEIARRMSMNTSRGVPA